MDTICEQKPLNTETELFGRTFAYPFFAGPVGAVKLHYGDKYTDQEYNEILLRGCADNKIAAFTGDGTDYNVMIEATDAIGKLDGQGIPTVKPWDPDTIREKMELVRNNMSARDLVPCVNLFSKVYVEEDGSLHFVEGHCKEGATVTLRTEMDMIFIVSNTPNPLDPAEKFPSVPVSIEVYNAPEVDLTDECVNYRPENYRAFENTWEYYNLLGR